MSHYVHHVPGRLRIRTKSFRCNPLVARSVEQDLRATEGVTSVRHNERNGSLTIEYTPSPEVQGQVLQLLTEAGCLPTASGVGRGADSGIAATFGKAVVAAVAQQTVLRSFNSLAAILR